MEYIFNHLRNLRLEAKNLNFTTIGIRVISSSYKCYLLLLSGQVYWRSSGTTSHMSLYIFPL